MRAMKNTFRLISLCISRYRFTSPLAPAVCRSHQRCGIQRCAAPTSGRPLTPAVCRSNQRCAAATIACTSGADISESASEDFEPDMLSPLVKPFLSQSQIYFASNHPVVLVLYRCLRSGSVGVTMMVLWQSFCTRGELV